MKVLKFGGTSVGTVESLKNLKSIVDSLQEPAIIVVSALGGLTDKLIATAKDAATGNGDIYQTVDSMAKRHYDIIDSLVPDTQRDYLKQIISEHFEQLNSIYKGVSLIGELPEKILDRIVSFGERMSSLIVSSILKNAEHRDSLNFIKTEKWFNKNIAERQLTETLIKETFQLPISKTIVCGGFISQDKDSGDITNLGRGGSDYTAALIAAALNAEILEIWTDVNGFMTSDPRIIKDAHVIEHMTFIESMELCSFGAKVIYPPTIYPVFHKNIPIRILNTHNPSAPGTLITDSTKNLPEEVRGVSAVKNSAMITISGSLAANVAEINTRSYNAMARNGISIFLVSQPNTENSFSMSMSQIDCDRALQALEEEFAPEIQIGEVTEIIGIKNLAIIAVVRESIKEIKGLGARLVNTLQREGVEVKAISDGASETTVAIVTLDEQANDGLRLIHGACYN